MASISKRKWLKSASAAVLAVSSLAVAAMAWRMGYYSMIGPGPGLFPLILASLLAVLTVMWAFSPEPDDEVEPTTRRGMFSMLSVVGTIALSVFALEILGFALTVWLLMIINMTILGPHRAWLTLLLATLASGVCFYLFQIVLGVSLPGSMIPFLANLGL